MKYTTVDTIFSKLYRELRGTDLSETDIIEWVGEALRFLEVRESLEQAVAFLEVESFEAPIPENFQMVLQVAKNQNWVKDVEDCPSIAETTEEASVTQPVQPLLIDCNGKPVGDYYMSDYEFAYYRPNFDLQWEYQPWTGSTYYQDNYTPVRLANHTFFNTVVCKERDSIPYVNKGYLDEYTIVGSIEPKLRFNFEEGSVALAYLRNPLDSNTGYPLIPDEIEVITAITYYIRWKVAEWYKWSGREGAAALEADAQRLWVKYVRQAKNFMKMPKGIDQWQNLLEQTHHLIPRQRRYYGFFGKLGRAEDRNFNDPDYRKRVRQYTFR